jgi:hypothetical protein
MICVNVTNDAISLSHVMSGQREIGLSRDDDWTGSSDRAMRCGPQRGVAPNAIYMRGQFRRTDIRRLGSEFPRSTGRPLHPWPDHSPDPDRNNTFNAYNFVVATIGIAGQWEIYNSVLAVALAAINTGYQVLADVDWPPQTIQEEGGDIVNLPAYCHSLWLNAG